MIQGTSVNIGSASLYINVNEAALAIERAYDLLLAHCSLGALVDANERFDPPRCTEATRHSVMQKMENWVRDDAPESNIFWLYGGAGAGKADANRNDGNRLIPTISLQLVQSFQGLDVFLEEKVVQHPNLFKETRQNQILGLLVEPLVRLSIKETDGMESDAATLRSHPRLVVIDGLDECHDIDTQCDLLRIIGTALPHLPYPIRFLITSRPESHITRIFQHDLKDVVRYDLSDDPDADKDIRRFLDKEFSEIRRSHPLRLELPSEWPPQRSISSIVERSSGHFIYASTVIRFIRSPRHRPDDRLEVIVGLKQPYEKDRPYARLDSLYAFIFHEIQDPAELETIYVALGIMHLRSQKCGIFLLPQLQRSSDRFWIETLLVLRPGDLSLLFDPLLSLVSFEEEDIRIFHKSLFDYLLDPSRSESLLLDLGLAHGVAANFLIRDKVIQDKWDSRNFQHFAFHCQFAPPKDKLRTYLCFLALDKKISTIIFETGKGESAERSFQLRSILYFLQERLQNSNYVRSAIEAMMFQGTNVRIGSASLGINVNEAALAIKRSV